MIKFTDQFASSPVFDVIKELDPDTGEEVVKRVPHEDHFPTSDPTFEAVCTNGETVVHETGEVDFQKEIDSYRDDCDINVLVARFLAGDPDSKICTPIDYQDDEELLKAVDQPLQDVVKLHRDLMDSDVVFDQKPADSQAVSSDQVDNKEVK